MIDAIYLLCHTMANPGRYGLLFSHMSLDTEPGHQKILLKRIEMPCSHLSKYNPPYWNGGLSH